MTGIRMKNKLEIPVWKFGFGKVIPIEYTGDMKGYRTMNRENLQTGRQEAIRGFDIDGTFLECTPCGNGHINDTFMMSFDRDGETHRYSLQHMNRSVFRDPVSLMNNILHVTDYLKEQIRAQGGDPQRETLDLYVQSQVNRIL